MVASKLRNIQRKNDWSKGTAWLGVLLWMGLIFYLSAQKGDQSDALSHGLLEQALNAIAYIFPFSVEGSSFLNLLIRKGAHFGAYLILSLLVVNALSKSGFRGHQRVWMTFAISALYAVSDEIHQLYVPGRHGSIGDVLLDAGGALTGLVIYGIVLYLRKK